MGFIVEKDILEMNLILTGDIKHHTRKKLYQCDKTLAKYCEHTWENIYKCSQCDMDFLRKSSY